MSQKYRPTFAFARCHWKNAPFPGFRRDTSEAELMTKAVVPTLFSRRVQKWTDRKIRRPIAPTPCEPIPGCTPGGSRRQSLGAAPLSKRESRPENGPDSLQRRLELAQPHKFRPHRSKLGAFDDTLRLDLLGGFTPNAEAKLDIILPLSCLLCYPPAGVAVIQDIPKKGWDQPPLLWALHPAW